MKASQKKNQDGWPKQVEEVRILSSVDHSEQPSLVYFAQDEDHHHDDVGEEDGPSLLPRRPLLIALHTWSADYRQGGGQIVFANWCIQHHWHFLHPNFRGPNQNPPACGSDVAVQDILDAVHYMREQTTTSRLDEDRIYVVGVSGGGHMALLLAAKHPELWAGVSAWASISDLQAWWTERRRRRAGNEEPPAECPNHEKFQKYARDIESVLGGKPDGDSEESLVVECQRRSPVHCLSSSTTTTKNNLSMDINAGITDGRKGGSVPFSHSLHAFDKLCDAQDQMGQVWIQGFYQQQKIPHHDSKDQPLLVQMKDPLYQDRTIHYRRIVGNSRITIFEGGHEILQVAALNWLRQQCKGQPATWTITVEEIDWMNVDKALNESGK